VTRSYPTKNGYTLWYYEGCTQLHRGRFLGQSLFVVGRETPLEKLFKRSLLNEASDYAKANNIQVESINTAELCDQAVLDVYG
jgi:hypothetical protein